MTVHVYKSSDVGGTGPLGVAPGVLIAALDTCLVSGYGFRSIASISRVDSTATVTMSSPHGYVSGVIVRISGMSDSAYNGDFAVTVTGARVFTYQVSGYVSDPVPITASTVLLVNADGAAGSTAITDELGLQMTCVGGACISTSVAKFGGSIDLTVAGSYVTVGGDLASLELGNNDYTIECWFYADPSMSTAYGSLISCLDGTYGWELGLSSGKPTYKTTLFGTVSGTVAVSSSVWHHIGVCRSKNFVYITVDGIQVATSYGSLLSVSPVYCSIGATTGVGGYSNKFTGYIDAVRIVRGLPMYPTGFFIGALTAAPPAALSYVAGRAAYRYFRVTISGVGNGSGGNVNVSGMYFVNDYGVQYPPTLLASDTGTPPYVVSTNVGFQYGGAAFHGWQIGSFWYPAGSSGGQWNQIDMGSQVAVASFVFSGAADSISYSAKSFYVEASNTGAFAGEQTTFSFMEATTGLSLERNEHRTFNVSADVAGSGVSVNLTDTVRVGMAPAGWSKPFAGANTAAYKQGVGSNGRYMYIDDSVTASSTVQPVFKAYETMTSISAGTNAFLTSSWHKNYNNSASVYDIVATSSIIYMRLYNGSIYTLSIFGDFYSLKAGDINNTIAVGNAAGYNTAVDGCYTRETMATIANHALCRAHTQTGTGIACGKCGGPWGDNQYMGRSWFTYPSHMDGGLHLDTVKITEGAAGFRGVLPGLWVPMHGNYWQDRTIIEGAGPFAGKLFMVWYLGPPSGSDGRVFIEISDTWGLYNG